MAFVFADACRYLADVKRFVLERMTPLRTLKGRNAAAKSDLSVDTLRVRLVPSPTASLTEEDTTLELGPGSAAGFPPGLKKDRNLTDVFSVSYEQIHICTRMLKRSATYLLLLLLGCLLERILLQ